MDCLEIAVEWPWPALIATDKKDCHSLGGEVKKNPKTMEPNHGHNKQRERANERVRGRGGGRQLERGDSLTEGFK